MTSVLDLRRADAQTVGQLEAFELVRTTDTQWAGGEKQSEIKLLDDDEFDDYDDLSGIVDDGLQQEGYGSIYPKTPAPSSIQYSQLAGLPGTMMPPMLSAGKHRKREKSKETTQAQQLDMLITKSDALSESGIEFRTQSLNRDSGPVKAAKKMFGGLFGSSNTPARSAGAISVG